ncbi:MAG: tRNA (adenosine(37)-N6)-threonylcarbamoyltransferase complex ATPase subunit type 1 TsaE [Acidimicrobiales bacterium]
MIPSSFATTSPESTRHAGKVVADVIEPGDVVLLVGGLGTGKTTFVQGVAAGLGVRDEVTSPTFTLCQVYKGRLTVMHADLWRLERLNEVLDLALDEELEVGGVLLVEWGEAAESLYGEDSLVVHFDLGPTATDRLLRLEPTGERWERRVTRQR